MNNLGWMVVAAAVIAPFTAASRAEACGGAIWSENSQRQARPTPAALVAKAEKLLDEGKPALALASILEAYPKLEQGVRGNDPVATRALRISAVATVRSQGALSIVGAKAPVAYYDYDYGRDVNVPAKVVAAKTDVERAARMQWSIATLRALHTQNAGNTAVSGELGEALGAVSGNEEEALSMLTALSDQDLLGSPQAYATLARLRFQQGLTKKTAEALARCQAMTTTPAICGPRIAADPV
jgi:hypothetical protein